ncbi:hypothetical protein JAU75_20795 [Ochrobactrum sp. Q0168]|uniref:hypothetical protein n=1 Tax=Ochrobactrum sp. Q0168 TaxID=2793241 RepID=UPI0018ECF777|nr:hypothetical protein [Ochrobactrum sp. Q0168]
MANGQEKSCMTLFTGNFIRAVSDHAATAGISHVCISAGHTKLELWLDSAAPETATHGEALAIRAFTPGIFRKEITDRALQAGISVVENERLGWLETGDLIFEVKTPKSGILEQFDANDGNIVGYNTILASIRA